MLTIEVVIEAGSSIEDACFQALMLARLVNVRVHFDFNGTSMNVLPRNEVSQLTMAFDLSTGPVICSPMPY